MARLKSIKKQVDLQRAFDLKRSTLQRDIEAAFADDKLDKCEELEKKLKALVAAQPQQGSSSSVSTNICY